jgi:Uma2 family endonuclease
MYERDGTMASMRHSAARALRDPTVYREEDEVGEHEIQTYILELLRPLVERFLAQRGVRAHVGSDQFVYWKQHDPTASIAPDLYVLPGVPQDIAIDVWKVWERGVVPSFVLEVVGKSPEKDYDDAPRRYAELGVKELVVFDPFPGDDRVSFQVFRRVGRRPLQRLEVTDGDRVRSRELGCFVRAVGRRASLRLRLAAGKGGGDLFPTAEESERAAREMERAARETERAAREAERAAREAALAELNAARARIAELERKLGKH